MIYSTGIFIVLHRFCSCIFLAATQNISGINLDHTLLDLFDVWRFGFATCVAVIVSSLHPNTMPNETNLKPAHKTIIKDMMNFKTFSSHWCVKLQWNNSVCKLAERTLRVTILTFVRRICRFSISATIRRKM